MPKNKHQKLLTIIIPCRNEEAFIGQCLKNILENGYPPKLLEVIVVDGMSADRTLEQVKKYQKKFGKLLILKNRKKTTPHAVNMGIKKASGDYIIWTSAHSKMQKNYLSICVKTMNSYRADSVGGLAIAARAKGDRSALSQAIVNSFNSPFGSGGAKYRNKNIKKISYADTAFGQCYRKQVFQKFGLLNENLTRSQDFEFSRRINKNNANIILNPKLKHYYYPRNNLKKFITQTVARGAWAVKPRYYVPNYSPSLRHLVPFFFVLSLLIIGFSSLWVPTLAPVFIGLIFLYAAVNFWFSLKAAKNKFPKTPLILQMAVFALLHLLYGLGTAYGIAFLIIKRKLFAKNKKR